MTQRKKDLHFINSLLKKITMKYFRKHKETIKAKGRLEEKSLIINFRETTMTMLKTTIHSSLAFMFVGIMIVLLVLGWFEVLPTFASEAYADPAPFTTLTQNDVQWFSNALDTQLTDARTAENAVLEDSVVGDLLRLQMNVTVGASPLWKGSQSFALEYAKARNCTIATAWNFVGGVQSDAPWRLHDNVTMRNGTDDKAQLFTSDFAGAYSETNPSPTNPNTIGAGGTMEWDWSLENNGATENATYCFRMVRGSGSAFEGYNADGYGKLVTAEK